MELHTGEDGVDQAQAQGHRGRRLAFRGRWRREDSHRICLRQDSIRREGPRRRANEPCTPSIRARLSRGAGVGYILGFIIYRTAGGPEPGLEGHMVEGKRKTKEHGMHYIRMEALFGNASKGNGLLSA